MVVEVGMVAAPGTEVDMVVELGMVAAVGMVGVEEEAMEVEVVVDKAEATEEELALAVGMEAALEAVTVAVVGQAAATVEELVAVDTHEGFRR